MPEMMEFEQIAERLNRKTEPVLRIAENPTRERSGDEARNDGMAGGPSGIDVLRQAAQEGLTVHIGDDEYYVRSINKYFANLYPTADIDALPGEIDGRTMDWDALKKDPYSLASEIRSNELRVTDYFLDINDFRDAVVGNTRNAAVIERMGLTVPDRNDPLIPVLQSDGSPYYTVGDKVYIDEEQPVEILAIGNGHVWYSRRDDDSGTVLLDFQRYFESKFFENQLNNDAIERAREIERSGEKQLISSVNLPELTRRLNEERKDMKAWEAAHPGKTVQEWLHEISKEIKCESYGPLGQPPKGTDLWRINLKGCDESLFYDFVDQKFMYGKTSDVYRTKEAEHKRYLERLETLAERLNDRLTDFKKSDAPNMRHYVTDLLAEANREIRGDCVSISTDGERGIYVRYVDKHDNPYIPTILYDGNEGKFLAGSLHDLERKQMDKYEHLQNEKKELAKFEDMAAKNNARLSASKGRPDEERDQIAYDLLVESMVSMGGENTSGMYQKDRGPVIDYVDIGDRHPFTLVYDRESKTFLVGDPHELLKEKERERSERENSASKPEKAYDLNYGHMGNGLVVWNRLEEKNGDYVTVAHIDPDRHVTFHDGDMPEGVKEKILDIARTSDARISATQDIPVFNTPPIGHSPVFYGRSEENWDAYFESHRQNEECARALEKAFKEHYKNNRINIEGVLEALEGYSKERISIVLANTMRLGQSDGRFSSQNRQWQKSIRLPESALTHNTLITSHSELVNYLVTTLREREMSATPKPAIDPIRTAKDILGRGSIVTDAQPGRTYTGEMIRVGERHAVQKIAPDRGIVHNLGDIADADAMFSRGGENREVRVSYDEDGRGSANPVTKDGKRKKGISR